MAKQEKQLKILLTGGGTGGSVAPLLAVYDDLKTECDFVWLGTWHGIEKQMVAKEKIKYFGICSGKLRRYWDWRNLWDPFLVIIGWLQALLYLVILRPQLVMVAGGYVGVPVVLAARVMRIPVLVHQLDYRPGLANRIMGYFATQITVSLEKSVRDFKGDAEWTGSPVRKSFRANDVGLVGLKEDVPVLLVLGGGTGAAGINKLVEASLKELSKVCQIIHLTGKGKMIDEKVDNYYAFEFFDNEQMARAMYSADLIISRAGMGVLIELAYLQKASIIIPMPASHQEDNAKILSDNNAAIVLSELDVSSEQFCQMVEDLLENKDFRQELGSNLQRVIKYDKQAIAKLAKNIAEHQKYKEDEAERAEEK
jgi:UDP-N-acetylglucosamine--N-acetylmuramyl-(pentapeptide) pyrophosphoryl-undecaprenol N-acetylglucosamine transferase